MVCLALRSTGLQHRWREPKIATGKGKIRKVAAHNLLVGSSIPPSLPWIGTSRMAFVRERGGHCTTTSAESVVSGPSHRFVSSSAMPRSWFNVLRTP
jgi:hypothetical protein